MLKYNLLQITVKPGFGVWGLGFGVWGLGFGVWRSEERRVGKEC